MTLMNRLRLYWRMENEYAATLALEPPALYAAVCRWRRLGNKPLLETWLQALVVGEPLPMAPLWLAGDLAVPLELEASNEETCRILRIA
jgi:hypothetical protein